MIKKRNKFDPIPGKRYLLTDSCYWNNLTDEQKQEYNPYDKSRTPHGVQLVDIETGTIVNLKSGSVIQIVEAKE